VDTVVLRPLPALAPAEPIVLGMHLDSEGNPRIVLDPEELAMKRQARVAESGTQRSAQQATHPILIVDDSLTTRMLESSILESAGFSVELAASGEEGLDMARRNSYALFLVDVEMPGMDGFSFVERARADPLLCEVPSILVTSRDSQEDRRRGKATGARAYIVKSEFDQVVFLERVTELVQR
jgi:two-component system chemotaxis sensor kinase CheA